MSHHQDLAKDAQDAYRASKSVEAALQFQHAAQVALDLDDRAAWYAHIVWAAISMSHGGDDRSALSLLLTARISESDDASVFERWILRKYILLITFATRPFIMRLNELMADLRTFSAQHTYPAADLSTLDGGLKLACGSWSAALQCFEKAWQDHDGNGFLKSDSARAAAECCLQLGKFDAASDWINAIGEAGDDKFVYPRYAQARLRVMLGLATKARQVDILGQLRMLADLTNAQQSRDAFDELRSLVVRVALLNQDDGSPLSAHHPARQELRRRLRNSRSVHGQYRARLLFADYRLACLRHAVGIRPVDDLYYMEPQQLSASPPRDASIAFLLGKARTAAQWAMAYAGYVDGLLACNWRQYEVQTRIDRIDQIAMAIEV